MSIIFSAPIPGQSLTTEPKNMPFERPPQITDPIEALDMHIENITNQDALEDVFYFLEEGLTLTALVEGILRSAVMEGIHSIDVSLIVAPVLHEYIKGMAIQSDVEFDEGFDNPEAKKALTYSRDRSRANKILAKLRKEDGEFPEEIPKPLGAEGQEEPMGSEPMQEESMGSEPMQEESMKPQVQVEQPAPQGLMARG